MYGKDCAHVVPLLSQTPGAGHLYVTNTFQLLQYCTIMQKLSISDSLVFQQLKSNLVKAIKTCINKERFLSYTEDCDSQKHLHLFHCLV